MKKVVGIYKITCTKNGRVRIGHASDIHKRWSNYKATLRHNKYEIIDMQEDWNIYGEDSFTFEIEEECPKYKLRERENYYILKYNSIENGYNDMLNDLTIPKKIRRGKEAKKYQEHRSEITAGENNGHNTKLSEKDVFEILNMKKDGIDTKIISEKYDISEGHTYNIGKYKWIKAYEEWKNQNKMIADQIDTSIYNNIDIN